MSPGSKGRQSRPPWNPKATRRADQHRHWRQQLARVKQQRDRPTTARKEAQARRRQREAQSQGRAVQHQVALVFFALQLFFVARLGLRAVSRVLSRRAVALGIQQAPCPQTIINGVTRRSIVRRHSARLLQGSALSQGPVSHGLLWMSDVSIALGRGKIVAVLARDAHPPPLKPAAPGLGQGRGRAVSVAASWTGESSADLLQRLIAPVGRPAASLQ